METSLLKEKLFLRALITVVILIGDENTKG